MEYIEVIVAGISLLLAVIITICAKLKGKEVEVKSVELGPLTASISRKVQCVDRIELISVPIAGCADGILSPPLKILLRDIEGKPVTSKRIRLEFHDENGLLSFQNYSGKISAISDKNGIVVFDDLLLRQTGQVQIHIPVDNIMEVTDDIDIFPPGLNLDFWNEEVGTREYEEKLDRALRFAGNNLR